MNDIVLAVNGYPVSKPEDADRAFRFSREQAVTTLYVLDLERFRQNIWTDVLKETLNSNFTLTLTDNSTVIRLQRTEYSCRVHVDENTLLLRFHEAGRHDDMYRKKFVKPVVSAFNDAMERRLQILEEDVICEAWELLLPIVDAKAFEPIVHAQSALESDVEVFAMAVLQRMSESGLVYSCDEEEKE